MQFRYPNPVVDAVQAWKPTIASSRSCDEYDMNESGCVCVPFQSTITEPCDSHVVDGGCR